MNALSAPNIVPECTSFLLQYISVLTSRIWHGFIGLFHQKIEIIDPCHILCFYFSSCLLNCNLCYPARLKSISNSSVVVWNSENSLIELTCSITQYTIRILCRVKVYVYIVCNCNTARCYQVKYSMIHVSVFPDVCIVRIVQIVVRCPSITY